MNVQSAAVDTSKQLVSFITLAHHNLGPQLFGCFPSGRIEEYIEPSHLITNDELMHPEVNKALARKLANVHSLTVPISKTSGGLVSLQRTFPVFIKNSERFRNGLDPQLRSKFDEIVAYDIDKEMNWFCSNLPKIGFKRVFCLNDMNRSNILVKDVDEGATKSTWYDRIYLIDSEYASYAPRAKDIANHFLLRCVNFSSDCVRRSGLSYPSRQLRMSFIEEYAREQNAVDDVEQLWLEVEFYRIGAMLSLVTNLLVFFSEKRGTIELACECTHEHQMVKEEFLEKYGHLIKS